MVSPAKDSLILLLLLIWYGVFIRNGAGAVSHIQLLFMLSRGTVLSRSTIIFLLQQCVVSEVTLFDNVTLLDDDKSGLDAGSKGCSPVLQRFLFVLDSLILSGFSLYSFSIFSGVSLCRFSSHLL